MNSNEFYRDVDAVWCQGDIVRQVPHIHLKPPLKALRKQTMRSGEMLAPFEYHFDAEETELMRTAPNGGFNFSVGENVEAFCQLALGMVLTDGCEIDKDTKHRQVALIRPLNPLPLESQQTIRENRNFSYCYLPAYANIIAESYVDFRRVTTLHPDYLRLPARILSLTDEALKYMKVQFIRYVTRLELNPEMISKLL